jgi:hypothetical protein
VRSARLPRFLPIQVYGTGSELHWLRDEPRIRHSCDMQVPEDRPIRADVPGLGRSSDGLAARLAALPDSHPSSAGYAADTLPQLTSASVDSAGRRNSPDRVSPLDDAEFAAHMADVAAGLEAARESGLETRSLYTVDPERKVWDFGRMEKHSEIIDKLYREQADAPCDGHAVMAGGLGGAGKGTVLGNHAGIDRSRYLTVDPDRIKEEMAARGMVPEVDGLSPMECSPLVHEESSLVASGLARRAYADSKNVIWDITMSNLKSAEHRIDELRAAGYRQITGIFVDIPAEKSVERAMNRYRRGMELHRNGMGDGGRLVPPSVILAQRAPDGGTVNRHVFDALKPRFDRWMVFDNSRDGEPPVLIDSSDWEHT